MPGKNPLTRQEKSAILGGTVATLAGLGLVLVSIDVIHADPESFLTPRWVLTLTGMMFVFAGLSIFSRELFSPAEQRDPILMWIQYFLVVGMLASFAGVFLWIGLGPGKREFSSSVSFLFFSLSGKGDELIGRVLFGGCGIGVGLITVLAALGGARRIKNETANRDLTNE